jgi:hypothetical protein
VKRFCQIAWDLLTLGIDTLFTINAEKTATI